MKQKVISKKVNKSNKPLVRAMVVIGEKQKVINIRNDMALQLYSH